MSVISLGCTMTMVVVSFGSVGIMRVVGGSVMGVVVARSAVMGVVVTVVVRWSKESFRVVPCHVSEDAILDVSSQKSFFAEGRRVLFGVDSPAHVSSKEKRSFVSGLNLLVKVKLEKLFRLTRAVHS